MIQGLRAILIAFAAAGLGPLADAAPPRTVQGMVTEVTDGDTVWLTPAGQPAIEVRLRDIDAPESCQPWGDEARKALQTLALNKVATLQISGKDSRGRTIGVLMIEELNVGRYLVENGHAWSLRTRWDQGPLVKQEKMARALSRGLHGTPGAVQPQDFRRRHGKCPPASEAPAAAPASAARR
jgi:micrococcal nuclease